MFISNIKLCTIGAVTFLLSLLMVNKSVAQLNNLSIPHNLTIQSFDFHLYTDSLKKGTYNYINVDALLSDSSYWPLDSNYLQFTSTNGSWSNNRLLLGTDSLPDSVRITASLKSKPTVNKQIVIYIKKIPNPEDLPSEKEVLDKIKQERKRK